jgi:hypothetical protein
MKRLAVVTILGAIALTTQGASAASDLPHRGPLARAPHFTTYGYARHPAENRFHNVFESESQGRQSYPNPDRDLPQSCGC